MPFDNALNEAKTYADMARGTGTDVTAGAIAATAQAFAMIAVVEELRALRHSVDKVTEALGDGHGFDVGSHMRVVGESLEALVERK